MLVVTQALVLVCNDPTAPTRGTNVAPSRQNWPVDRSAPRPTRSVSL